MAVDPKPNDDYLERVKAQIRAEADAARVRHPLPRHEPSPRTPAQAATSDGIEHDRLAYAIGELTGADYHAFVDGAFRALLKRAPDEGGRTMQVRLLASGASKAEVLGNLRWSPEGKRVGTRVRGLLPRYALAKLARVPALGYAIEWGLALAGLPLLLRHQRAADTATAARFMATTDTQRHHARRIDDHEAALAAAQATAAALGAEHDRRTEALRGDLQRLLTRADELERHAAVLLERVHRSDTDLAARANELVELRHHVQTTHHWLVSLQRNLGELDAACDNERERTERLLAGVGETAPAAAARAARHALWSAQFAQRLPGDARVLDLGSGDGAWLDALTAHAVAASGVEASHALVMQAHQHGKMPLAHGDPRTALARCADASLEGLSIAAALLSDAATAADMFGHAARVIGGGGWLLLRIEREPYRLFEQAGAVANIDAREWMALLAAAGFAPLAPLVADGTCALLAQRS